MRHMLFLAALLAAGGCGMTERVTSLFATEDTGVQPTPLTELVPLVTVEERWSRGFGKGTDELFVRLEPLAADGAVYVAERGGDVAAIGAENGRILWKTDTDARLSGGPGLAGDQVLVGSSDGEVIALAAADGAERWRTRVTSEVLAAPVGTAGIVVARSGDGNLFGLKAGTGDRVWTYDRSVPVLSLRGTSQPVLVDDLVLAGFDNGRLAALELATGRLVWEATVAVPRGRSDLERMVDIDATPVVYGRSVYAATFQGRVVAIDIATGDIEWARDISSAAGLAVDLTRVYVTDEHSVLWALDRRSGATAWKQEALKARRLTAPAVSEGYVVVGDLEGYLYWLRQEDGELAARRRLDKKPLIAPPVTLGPLLIAYSSGGALAAYALR